MHINIYLQFPCNNGKYNKRGVWHMAIPVKFYSVTPEEYDRLRKQMEQGVDGSEEAQERKRALEGGIFFVEDKHDEVKDNGST
jgi:hypothetical protein